MEFLAITKSKMYTSLLELKNYRRDIHKEKPLADLYNLYKQYCDVGVSASKKTCFSGSTLNGKPHINSRHYVKSSPFLSLNLNGDYF